MPCMCAVALATTGSWNMRKAADGLLLAAYESGVRSSCADS